MQKVKQVLLSLVTLIFSFYFVFWISSALVSIPFGEVGPKWIYILSATLSVLAAGYLAFVVWKKNDKSQNAEPSHGTYIVYGALGLGLIGFILGFVGPILLTPDANQGPLLGIIYTGPAGIAIGAVGGSILWMVKGKHTLKK